MKYFLLFIVFLSTSRLSAQLDFGEFNTPYAGVHALSFNPAEIVDSRYKFHMSLMSIGLRVSNNYAGANTELFSFSPPKIVDSNKKYFIPQLLDGKPKNAYAQMEYKGLTFSLGLGKKNKFGLALSSGVKVLVTANNISQQLANYFYDSKDTLNWKESTSKDLMFNASAWAYAGLTVGTVLFDKPKFSLKAAVTGKINVGLASSYAYSPNLRVSFASSRSIRNANGVLDNQVASPIFVNEKYNSDSFNPMENIGFGTDIGLIYEKKDGKEYTYEMDCRTDNIRKDQNKYRFRIGISLVDFGYIKWKGKSPLRRVVIDGNAFTTDVGNSKFNKFPDVGKHRDSMLSLYYNGVMLDTSRSDYYMWTPTKVNIFFDLRIYKTIYLAANATYGFVLNNFASSWTQNTQFAVTPRLEGKFFGLYLPVNYNMLAQEANVGIGFRALFMNFALYDWTGLAGLKSQTRNAAFNLSFNIPFHQRKQPKDNDHDLISNKKDKCKNQAGDCNGDGCAEPDDDGDGISNTQDKCPNQAGPKSLDGCPDSDEDGLIDSKDRCPKKKGLRELGGCPDKDLDGVTDAEDKCPNDRGLKEFDGCPDRDKDKIPDYMDDCPTDSGVFENKGCPPVIILDSDQDGLVDTADKCPYVIGPISNKGCPIPIETISIAKMAQEKLEFESGSAIIKKESYASLELLAQYLIINPQFNLSLIGHTDNVGKDEKNLKLSIDRANAVKIFFMNRGVAEIRIKSDGFGMKYPIADNRTPAGRAANRRVDIDVK
jgi:outer membrane protein OmpA-like peptidoglycan-associated protein